MRGTDQIFLCRKGVVSRNVIRVPAKVREAGAGLGQSVEHVQPTEASAMMLRATGWASRCTGGGGVGKRENQKTGKSSRHHRSVEIGRRRDRLNVPPMTSITCKYNSSSKRFPRVHI